MEEVLCEVCKEKRAEYIEECTLVLKTLEGEEVGDCPPYPLYLCYRCAIERGWFIEKEGDLNDQ